MSKFLCMGLPLERLVAMATTHPAQVHHRPEPGTLASGSCADVAVLRIIDGPVHFADSGRARMKGDKRLCCMATFRAWQAGLRPLTRFSMPDWETCARPYIWLSLPVYSVKREGHDVETNPWNGNWHFRRTDSDWLPAYVPGQRIRRSAARKKIEDPYYRENESAAFDALRHSYEYQRTFSVLMQSCSTVKPFNSVATGTRHSLLALYQRDIPIRQSE